MAHQLAFFCSSPSWGGLEINTLRYAAWIQEKGFTVTVFALHNSRLYQEAKLQKLAVVGIKKHRKYADIFAAFRLKKVFQQHRIDLVFFRDNRDFDLLAWTKRLSFGAFKLLYFQAMQLGVAKRNLFHTWRYSACDAWVCTLPFLKKQVAALTRFPEARTFVIPLGAELPASSNSVRSTLGLQASDFLMGTIGRIDPQKDQLSAIHAVHALSKEFPNLHLLLVGESTLNEGSTYEKELKRKVHHLHLQKRIHFMPFTPHVASVYEALDGFLMTSLGETFGTVTIEALGYGVPVIGTNTSGTPEILSHGECGLLYTPGDVDQLSQHIHTLINDTQLRQQLAENGQKKFKQLYSKEASVQALVQLIQTLFRS